MAGFPNFKSFFEALWAPHDPFPWQRMLAEQIAEGCWPKALDLPTAAGKTACIDAAVYALAAQAGKPVADRTAPRRIWFVVDRRIVVDEAFDRASIIAERLRNAKDGPLKAVTDQLRRISGTERPLAVARLRGGVLRDDGWARLPSQPAVITSTVDQLGSRLLFRGYGPSKLSAPIFAGLAAHDSLILLDEAHCSVPFLQTLRAIEAYRGKAWAESPITTPFAFVILSATRPPDIPQEWIFPGARRQAALDHPVLRDRLTASKPAELLPPLKTSQHEPDPLVDAAAKQALCYVEQHGKRRVAVIVNRVRTAKNIAKELTNGNRDTGDVDVVLLTGRLRPYERDKLVDRWKPVLKAAQPKAPEKPVVLVSTQCIEVGADFSFDALVTEAASLDALRQRFGRLNRMGMPAAASAAILIREPDTKQGQIDPVYGTAIAECWRLLTERATSVTERRKEWRTIDFGFDPLDKVLSAVEDVTPCLAPRPNAPFLLPAHLDLLCQTAPTPQPEPDIQLFLHGTDQGVPEVRIVWRADLRQANTETWAETIALCPPNSGEMLSAPLHAVRNSLADGVAGDEDAADVEGGHFGIRADPTSAGRRIRPALVWSGRNKDRSRVRRRSSDIRPNDVVIVPSEYGIGEVGQSQPAEAMGEAAIDLWEPSRSESGRPKALRLHRDVLRPWLRCAPLSELVSLAENPASDGEEIWAAVDAVVDYRPATEEEAPPPPEWLLELFRFLARGDGAIRNGRIESYPDDRGRILFARTQASWRTAEPDLFADDDDLLSISSKAMSLAQHSGRVEWAAEKLVDRCLPDGFLGPLLRAAYWHDVGKLDERFQVLLYEGDEVAAVAGEALAKSANLPASPARRHAIHEASRLPEGFRHEMLSYQLAQRYAPLPDDEPSVELILHLIASHHGFARPFAPVVPDPDPPAVSGLHDGITIALVAAERASLVAPHALCSGLPDRFWRLTRRYGWWGLAYLEAVLRLADWYGSIPVHSGDIETAPTGQPQERAHRAPPRTDEHSLPLPGLNGANPLGFLAALGTLAVIRQQVCPDARLGWQRRAVWQPVITGDLPENNALCEAMAAALRGNAVSADAEARRKTLQENFDNARTAETNKKREISKRNLRGKERTAAIEAEVEPLEREVGTMRREWLAALQTAIPSPELALGKHINCTAEEYRDYAASFLQESDFRRREALDLLADFASDACLVERSERVFATPFCFITGSGHQYFLETVRALIGTVTTERVGSALFERWTYADETLSMRWDPAEDRRYALLDRDPTASGNKPRTMWMANLLAYRALALFPSVPTARGLRTTGWDDSGGAFTWPLWGSAAAPDTIRSLMLLGELGARVPDRTDLRARGIVAVYRASRIKVGSAPNFKINFSPAREI